MRLKQSRIKSRLSVAASYEGEYEDARFSIHVFSKYSSLAWVAISDETPHVKSVSAYIALDA